MFVSFEEFERINYERDIIISCINPVINLNKLPVRMHEHE